MTRALAPTSIRLLPTATARERDSEWTVASLTSAMKQLDEAAYREFFKRYYKRLFAHLLKVAGGDRRYIEDSLQTAFPKIVNNMKVFDCDQAFWNWICQISRNSLIDTYRREGSRSRVLRLLEEASQSQAASVSNPSDQRLQQLQKSVETLPEAERTLITSKYLDGMSYAAIAHRLDTTEKAVESKLARIRRKLRKLIGKEHTQ